MNTFKTAVVLATLLGVGYGVHVVLNKPLNTTYPELGQAPLDDFGLPRLEIEGLQGPVAGVANNAYAGGGALGSPQSPTPDHAPDYQPEEQAQTNVHVPSNDSFGDPAHNGAHVGSQMINPADAAGDSLPDPPLDPRNFPELPSLGGDPGRQSAGDSTLQATHQASREPTWTPQNQPYPETDLAAPIDRGAVGPGPAQMANNASAGAPFNPPSTAGTELPPFATPINPDSANPDSFASGPGRAVPFANIWQSAQAKIQAGQFGVALMTLSLSYSDPALTSEQRAMLVPLLDELAGKVIYSREHHLEAPYTVRQGDTLSQIATNYAVTPEFLARVNGLDDQIVLVPGQQLKVVAGPFRAEISLGNREITVFVGNYYAGRFMAGVGRDLPLGEMALEVAEKSGGRPYIDRETNQQTVAGDPENPYGNYWIGLRVPGTAVNPYLGLHSTGSRVEASDTRGCLSLSERDADDLQAILTIGSRVTVHR